ncbi:Dolichyl-phosphate-mannose-protein mannosyltransferase [uncultured archaeon]|nr:Dolichyl-phosphate-mannose-protein mannosyltransferase [uncultured archaeon]
MVETEASKEKFLLKVKKWLKDPQNLVLIGILLLALVLRLYYFFLTTNQPLWWDESEYMLKAKSFAFGTPDTGWWYGRPILFSVISSFFFKVGLGELGIRFLWVLVSLATVYLVFYLGKTLFNKKIGLIAALLASLSYIDLFYTLRLLVNLPEVFFALLAYALFVKVEFGQGSKKLIWAIIPIILIGVLIRFTVGLTIIVLLVFLLSIKGLKLLKEKEWYISILIGLLLFLPYGIYSWIKYGNPVYVIMSVLVGSTGQRAVGDTPFKIFIDYIKYLPSYTQIVLFIFFIIGLVVILFNLVILFDKIKSESSQKKNLFIIIAFLIPLIYFGFFVNHFEDRYLSLALPFIFIITAYGLFLAYNFIKIHINKIIALVFILGILLFGCYSMYTNSNAIITDKINSYSDLRDTGIWIKTNSLPTDAIISAAVPELTYYSERPTYHHADNLTGELSLITEKNVKFLVITSWEKSPDWTYEFFSKPGQFPLVHQSVSTYRGQQMFALVFWVNSSSTLQP